MMRSFIKHSPLSLLRMGLGIFALGLVWDLIYHTVMFVTNLAPSPTQDMVGSLGHIVTVMGMVIILTAQFRRRAQ